MFLLVVSKEVFAKATRGDDSKYTADIFLTPGVDSEALNFPPHRGHFGPQGTYIEGIFFALKAAAPLYTQYFPENDLLRIPPDKSNLPFFADSTFFL